MPRLRNATTTLCEPVQPECTWTRDKMREFTGKCRAPGARQPLCTSLRSRNAHGHVTRAILCENIQEKCRKLDGVPWSNPGLNTYRKNPSVWTRCLRKNLCGLGNIDGAESDLVALSEMKQLVHRLCTENLAFSVHKCSRLLPHPRLMHLLPG